MKGEVALLPGEQAGAGPLSGRRSRQGDEESGEDSDDLHFEIVWRDEIGFET